MHPSTALASALATTHHDSLSRGQQRAVVGAIVGLHVAVGWALLQVPAVREVVADAAPMFVDLIAPPAPPQPVPPPPPPTQRVVTKTPPPAPLITAAPSPAPATFTAPPPPDVIEAPAPSAPPAIVTVQAPPAAPAPAPAPAPKMLPASAVQYLEPVTPVYSSASARAREVGRVVARVFIDENGLPHHVQLQQSSGFVRLDEAWLTALKKSRFKPPTENGQPVAGWALAPFLFEL